MEQPILLDTDILVDFFRGFDKAVDFINKYNDRIILSSIVVAELYAGVKGDAEQNALKNFISLFRVVPIDAAVGKAGGLYRRDYGKSHGVGLADAIEDVQKDLPTKLLKIPGDPGKLQGMDKFGKMLDTQTVLTMKQKGFFFDIILEHWYLTSV